MERKHIRLRNFDYSSPGDYFITICTKGRGHFFGTIISPPGTSYMMSQPAKMTLSEIGAIAKAFLEAIPQHFPNASIGASVIMPDHIHFILELKKKEEGVQPSSFQNNAFSMPNPGSVSLIVQQFKSAITRWCNKNGHSYFGWQSRFHERLIKDSDAFNRIRKYIETNPENWAKDNFH